MTTRPRGITRPRFTQHGSNAYDRDWQDKGRELMISVEDFRAPGDSDLTAFTRWKTELIAQTGSDLGAGPAYMPTGYIPDKTYTLNTADFTMPNCNILCEGKIVTGSYKLLWVFPKRIRVDGIYADHMKLSGGFFNLFTRFQCPDFTVDGYAYGYGAFWNSFSGVADFTIDLTNWSVNQNEFRNGKGRIKTIGTGSAIGEGHMNNAYSWDCSCAYSGDSGIFNLSSGTFDAGSYLKTIPQDSVHFGLYGEDGDGAGSGILKLDGPQHFFGLNGDVQQVPHVTRRNHILGTTNIAERLGDYLAADGINQLPSGNWSTLVLDDQGNECPADIFVNPRAPGMTTVDTTEPFGAGRSYGMNQTVAFAKAIFTVPPSSDRSFNFVLAYKSINDTPFAFATTVNRGGGDVTYYEVVGTAIPECPHWYLMRIPGKCNALGGANTTIEFTITISTTPNDIRFGSFFLTRSKTAFLPAPQDIVQYSSNVLEVKKRYIQHGEVAQTNVAAPPSVDVAVVFPKAFSAVPIITSLGIRETSAASNNFTKIAVKTGTLTTTGFTARVTYAGNWDGAVFWEAKGLK